MWSRSYVSVEQTLQASYSNNLKILNGPTNIHPQLLLLSAAVSLSSYSILSILSFCLSFKYKHLWVVYHFHFYFDIYFISQMCFDHFQMNFFRMIILWLISFTKEQNFCPFMSIKSLCLEIKKMWAIENTIFITFNKMCVIIRKFKKMMHNSLPESK